MSTGVLFPILAHCTKGPHDLRDPKTLPCFHSFCSPCIDDVIKEQLARLDHLKKLQCPQCHGEFDIPRGGSSAFLPVDHFVQQLIHQRDDPAKSADPNDVKCSCEEEEASVRCAHCESFLGKSCLKAHSNFKATAGHLVISLDEYFSGGKSTKGKVNFCSSHPGFELNVFCRNCSVPICQECSLTEHSSHTSVKLSSVDHHHFSTEIMKALAPVQVREKELRAAILLSSKTIEELNQNAQSATKEITQAFANLPEFQKRKDTLLSETEAIRYDKEKNLILQKEELEFFAEGMRSCGEFARGLVEEGSQVEIAMSKKTLLSRLSTLRNVYIRMALAADSVLRFEAIEGEDEFGTIHGGPKLPETPALRADAPAGDDSFSYLGHLEDLPDMAAGVLSGILALQTISARGFRKLLSKNRNPPIEEVIATGLVPKFVEFLGYNHAPKLQFEVAWILSNLTSGSSVHVELITDSGAVPFLVELLSSPDVDVREQAIWALSNIAADNARCRDAVINSNALTPLLLLLAQPASQRISLVRIASGCLQSLFRGGNPCPDWRIVETALPTLSALLHLSDEEVLADVCWAISYFSASLEENISAVIQTGMVVRIVELLGYPSLSVQTPALRATGNLAAGTYSQAQAVVDAGFLEHVPHLLGSRESIVKEACWTISNITAGTVAQIQAVLDARVIPSMIEVLRYNDKKTKKDAAYALCNAASGGTKEQYVFLLERKCIRPLCDFIIECDDVNLTQRILEAFLRFLEVGVDFVVNGKTLSAVFAESAAGMEKIHQLCEHENMALQAKAQLLVAVLFGGDQP